MSDPSATPPSIRRVLVVGVGRMGGGLARNLARHGSFEVTVFDRSAEAVARCVEAGATAATSVVDAAGAADLVVSSLPMPADVVGLVEEVVPHLQPQALVMDTSTIDPATAGRVAALVGERRFVSCLLGKGPAQAEAGEVPLFVGGHDQALQSLSAVFECIGERVHRLGSVEAATAFKLVSNLVGMANLAVLAEGYALCRDAGVDDADFTEALRDTGAWSYQAEVRLPWMIDDDLDARFAVTLALKDLALAVDMAARRRIPVPVGAAAMSQLAAAAAHGHGDLDAAAVLRIVAPPNPGDHPV
jgi:3-hydroxyisobutyrate dehydrogenase